MSGVLSEAGRAAALKGKGSLACFQRQGCLWDSETGCQTSTDAALPALQGCRPCKMFSRKYQRMAEQFQECIFLDVVGDETTDTRVSAARPWSSAQASIINVQTLWACVLVQSHALQVILQTPMRVLLQQCLGNMPGCTGFWKMVFPAVTEGCHSGGHLQVLVSCSSLHGLMGQARHAQASPVAA